MKKLIFLFILVSHSLCAQVDLKKLDAYLAKALKNWDMPGMSVAIVKDGKVIFSKGYGVKELGKSDKVDGNTLYAIASNTKAFTTASIAMMIQERKLGWDDKVRKYLPYFELYDRYVSDEVNIRDMLSHRIGLETFSGDAIWYLSDNMPAEQIIRRAKYLPKSYDFRSGYGYSNIMYITAGELMRTIDGKSWNEIIQQRILNPLKMDRTVTTIKDLDKKGNYATPHSLDENKKSNPIAWEDWSTIAATGGIVSSVNDMAKWMIFNLNNGINGKDTLLTPASRNMLWRMHNIYGVNYATNNEINTHFSGYALGWGVSDYHGRMRVGHTGGYSGMLSAVMLVPDEKLGVVVLTNGMKPLFAAVRNYIIERFLGLPERDWSAEVLADYNRQVSNDNRVQNIKKARIEGTKPITPPEKLVGTYNADIYGDITITKQGDELRMSFEHSQRFNATLKHWHYNVYEIQWESKNVTSWFNFGTVRFVTDNNLEVQRLEFDVPNNDIWFYELKPMKIK